jgi:hypothetical protein
MCGLDQCIESNPELLGIFDLLLLVLLLQYPIECWDNISVDLGIVSNG